MHLRKCITLFLRHYFSNYNVYVRSLFHIKGLVDSHPLYLETMAKLDTKATLQHYLQPQQ